MVGMFIVVEGGDRSGKSTLCESLVARLNQEHQTSVYKKFPDRSTASGKIINSYLQNGIEMDLHAIHLLFSANRWEAMAEFKSILESGTHIVLDRYSYSGQAFSVANGLDPHWCRNSDIGLLIPDAVFYLDLSPEVAQQRGGFGNERYEVPEIQTKVRTEFLKMASEQSWHVIKLNSRLILKLIDANTTKELILDQVSKIVLSNLPK